MELKRYLPTLNVLALIAVLIFTTGPSAYAAGKRLVTGADVQDNSLTGADVQDSSLSGSDIADGSITSADVDSSVGALTPIARPAATRFVAAGASETVTLDCPQGTYLLEHGYAYPSFDGEVYVDAVQDLNNDTYPDRYELGVRNEDTVGGNVAVAAYCPTIPQ